MNRLFRKTIIALLAIVWSVAAIKAQNVNMNRYITLTVESGTDIKFDIMAAASNTQVKIVSGSTELQYGTECAMVFQQSYYLAEHRK